MSGSASGEIQCEPNLTPILDMVFQLITFFVLIFNCKQAEMATGVNLPVIGSARPVKYDQRQKVIVFNCKFEESKEPVAKGARQPQIWVMGTLIPQDKLRSFVAAEARSSMMAAKPPLTDEDIASGKELTDIIIIRADIDIPFRMVNNVITACQEQGYRQFSFKALGERKERAGT